MVALATRRHRATTDAACPRRPSSQAAGGRPRAAMSTWECGFSSSSQAARVWYMAVFQLPRLPEMAFSPRRGEAMRAALIRTGLDAAPTLIDPRVVRHSLEELLVRRAGDVLKPTTCQSLGLTCVRDSCRWSFRVALWKWQKPPMRPGPWRLAPRNRPRRQLPPPHRADQAAARTARRHRRRACSSSGPPRRSAGSWALTQHELPEDPHDLIATHLLRISLGLTGSGGRVRRRLPVGE
jgi:hypothetical protein